MAVEEELARLRVENERLERELALARQELVEARRMIATLEQRISELEHGTDEPPRLGKANRPKPDGPQKPRKKRRALRIAAWILGTAANSCCVYGCLGDR